MLNPIDTEAVIREGGAIGRFPGGIHEGVAWWLGSCLVVTQRAGRIAVGHDGHPAIAEFAKRFCLGAINAQHYACNVRFLGLQTEKLLLAALKSFGDVPGAWLSAGEAEGGLVVRIKLYNRQGIVLDDTNGLAEIRRLVAEDQVPVPVNAQAKGTVEPWHPQLTKREDLP
ncbi:hypothetical protein AB0O64_13010 [Streptomyces sp. NPDC088341]|uniref:hypothetical protein n=1 Tax=Streptomyces sp. NPDC088341 TaxID=3154870 RepID=UPI003439F77D